MIQDISPKIFHNEYETRLPKPDDTVFSFHGREILCKTLQSGQVSCPTVKEMGMDPEKLLYLFRIDDQNYFLLKDDIFDMEEDSEQRAVLQSYSYDSTRILRRANPGYLCFAGMTAYHLYVWYRDNRFCGRCGGRTLIYDKERAMKCPACGNIIYPKICPAVIVGVTSGSRILMTRYAGRAYKGNALIAGFCEIGEAGEDTVRREVMEEVGIRVKNIRYFASQPWGFDSNLLLGYYCEADGNETVHMDENELSRAEWVERSDIGQEEKNLSLTATMMMHFKEHPEDFV